MFTHSTLKAACLAACFIAAPMVSFADDTSDTKPMGHSPAGKEHTMMNNPQTSSGPADTATAPSNGMGHSPAGKEHTMMNSPQASSGPADAATAPSNGMGHSPASKEHTMMKPETAPDPKK